MAAGPKGSRRVWNRRGRRMRVGDSYSCWSARIALSVEEAVESETVGGSDGCWFARIVLSARGSCL